jgi:biotin carboxyl carrier protein
MSNPGKVIQITARPAQAAGLAVEVDGIVEARTVQLGDSVTAFNFAGFYEILASTIAGSPGQLGFTSQEIRNYGAVASSALLTLRAESLKAALDKVILARENAFYTKYGSSAAIAAKAVSSYSNLSAGSKPQLLSSLSELATQRDGLLQMAYIRDGRTGIVESTTSQLTGHTASGGKSTAANTFTEHGTSAATGGGEDDTSNVTASGYLVEQDDSGFLDRDIRAGAGDSDLIDSTWVQGKTSGDYVDALTGARSETKMTVSSTSEGSSSLSGTGELSTDATGSSDETQTIINTGYDYHVPSIEAKAQYVRAQISLIDEQYDQFVDEQKMLNLNQIFANELKMIDLDVKQLQVAYLNTILLSPINGVVTDVFADAGDSVRAGELLVRVENNAKVLLEATLVYRGRVSVGDTVTVQTNLFSKPVGPPPHLSNSVTISGTVVAAHGDSDDDRWNIVVSCDNRDRNGEEILPLHYSFDHDDTSITIS